MKIAGRAVVALALLLHASLPSPAQDASVIIRGLALDDDTNQLIESPIITVFVQTASQLIADGGRAYEFLTLRVPPGRVTMVGRAEGYAPNLIEFNLGNDTPVGVVHRMPIRLSKGVSISGQVISVNGGSAEGASVLVDYLEPPRHEFLAGLVGGSAITAEDGRFEIDGLLPERALHVYATLGDARSERVEVEGSNPGHRWYGVDLKLR